MLSVQAWNRVRVSRKLPETAEERIESVRRIYIDQTGVGEVFMDGVCKSGLKNAQGISFTFALSSPRLKYSLTDSSSKGWQTDRNGKNGEPVGCFVE